MQRPIAGPSHFIRCTMTLIFLCTYSISASQAADAPYEVEFKTTCSAPAQAAFNEGVTLLHSFEYLETTRIFGEIKRMDPGCAMARWGMVMSIWHPLWAPPSQEDLRNGAAILAETNQLEMSAREAGYIAALKAFFSSTDTSTHFKRVNLFKDGMREVYTNNLDDQEAALFYALALLASPDPRDKSYPNQFKSAGLLNWVRGSQPLHPGVLHYLIHSYDFPGLAHLALDAAMIYADAAPNSAHAQHMPSHIFTRMGLWENSLASNHDSTRSAAEYTVRAHLPGHYDEGLHGMDYLMYAMLQTARDTEAQELLQTMRKIERTDTENFKVAYTYASAPARYVLERRRWDEARNLQLIRETSFGWEQFPWAMSIHHFARAIGAVRSHHLDDARAELAAIKRLQDEMTPSTVVYWNEQIQIHIDVVTSWILMAEGDSERALQIAEAAADREDSVDKHPVTPGEVLPARELYADLLFESARFEAALEQYQAVLRSSPNRLNSLLGAGQAAANLGKAGLSSDYLMIAREQTRDGNQDRSGLQAALSSTD